LGDVHELINFFVIESQRIVFAENVGVSAAAFFGAFLSYWLIKIVPYWILALIGTSVLFLTPLIYKTNQEFIDTQLAMASRIANEQAVQIKQIAGHHAAKATETTKAYVGDYSARAQEMIGNARGRSTSPLNTKKELNGSNQYKSEDFPAAPKDEFKATEGVSTKDENEPLVAI